MLAGNGLAHGCITKKALRGDLLVEGDFGSHLKLEESIGREQLVKGGKRLEGCSAGAESALAVSCGRKDAGLQSENRAVRAGLKTSRASRLKLTSPIPLFQL